MDKYQQRKFNGTLIVLFMFKLIYVCVVVFTDHKQSFCFISVMSFMRNKLTYFVPVLVVQSACLDEVQKKMRSREGTTKCCSTFMGKKGEMNVVYCESVGEKRIRGMDCILNTYITLMQILFNLLGSFLYLICTSIHSISTAQLTLFET